MQWKHTEGRWQSNVEIRHETLLLTGTQQIKVSLVGLYVEAAQNHNILHMPFNK